MKILVHPSYFPSIATFAAIVQHEVVWEAHDNFQKQTYRNRCYISTDKGKHMLNVPIKHVGGQEGRQKYVDVGTENSYNWKKEHWRTLETAYRTSPFFEFYEDELRPLYEDSEDSLYDFNLKTIETIADCIGLAIPTQKSEKYEVSPATLFDARFLVEAKKERNWNMGSYAQVFEERHGFIPNLSVLDLLFNEGTNTLSYLKSLSLDLKHA
ncbi:WbqC family protein [Flagellimonas halotolerans]|uniref:WbqC family protein n=1 Tax=Flagellimonas halotolerans TaxID=3112164 RepID=A0ABU6IQQ4_9FLAO|nr:MULTISPECIES: WbqC family protein [unclassified Allomuricauda]MEC3965552.1 WbqC family protein [Muricauda sp. SYSU M86414]MEC4265418.1 WbqC family protein [Muricauda sp. SYSU M84420]